MTDQEFVAANAAIAGAYAMRDSDTTPAQMDWILGNLGEPGRKILEIGPGAGAMTTRLRSAGHEVWTLDIYPGSAAKQHLQGTVERIPLPDKSFDVIVLAHVIEHSRSLTRAFLEMERVARERVLMVTPRQRFFRWTFDYHLHFFYSGDHLASHAPSGQTSTGEIDGDICLTWDVSRCGREPLPV
jgi:ubiquinone/menaquinone biosynthesis C-methylase UbiE